MVISTSVISMQSEPSSSNPSPSSAPQSNQANPEFSFELEPQTPVGFAGSGMPPEQPSFSTAQRQPNPTRIRFTGLGADYFPIWITNLLFTVLTFGIYGPWAKVRREKFFHQHTVIDGDSLDYHGNPLKILIGRIIALVIAGISYAQGLSIWITIPALFILAMIVPFALQRSTRFRLHNTSYRGLRFGFTGSLKDSYAIALLPASLIVFFFAGVYVYTDEKGSPPIWAGALFLVYALSYPLFHGLWRRYAINHAHYGTAKAASNLGLFRFILTYLIAAIILLIIVAIIASVSLPGAWFGYKFGTKMLNIFPLFLGIAGIYICLLSFWPLVGAMIQKLCWNRATRITDSTGHERAFFECDISPRKFVLLQLKNIFLTLISLGFYRPYAAVATAKAKLESVSISDMNFIDDVIALSEKENSAIGEEALGALDLDFSL
jgi:uncharacterized membrane protein YjgN (DUF898 family)